MPYLNLTTYAVYIPMFRVLLHSDYEKYKPMINEFRTTDFSYEQFTEVLDYVNRIGNIWICVEDDAIVATGTIFYEKKLIHNICTVAHIEDVCVTSARRGGGYGKRFIKHLMNQAKEHGCYKVTLNCSDENMAFYESCGLTKRGNQMCDILDKQ